MRELIVDSFAGGGGASMGIEMALGRSPDYAINHDEKALAMHQANHPNTVHLSKNIWQIDPMDVVGRRPVGLLWASPDCKHFSKAKGGRPVKRNVRDLAWTVVLWAKRARPRVIILENVEEFADWGPITAEGRPCPDRKGETFDTWVKELKRLGYKVDYQELRACDYGAPTIRKRLFVIARRDGQKIVWPEPTHGAPDSEGVKTGKLLPWRTAAEIIDWSLPCPSIFDSAEEIKAKYGLRAKRPLAENTMKRIARGVVRYALDEEKRFLVICNHSGDHFRGQSLDEAMPTITASRDAFGLVAPSLVNVANSKTTGRGPNVWHVEEPVRTVTASPGFSVVAPVLTGCGGRAAQVEPKSADNPLGTMTTKPDHVVAAAHLTSFYGEGDGGKDRCIHPDRPGLTDTAGGNRHGVVAAFLAQHNAGPRPGMQAKPVDAPISTITAAGSQQGIVAANLIRHFGKSVGSTADEPVGTITAGGDGKTGIVAAHMMNMRGSDRRDAGCDDPLNTISAGGQHAALIATFLDTYYGKGEGWGVDRPMPTDTTRDRSSLVSVEVDGETFVIADIGLRMLTPRERFRAQGFPDQYIIDTGVLPDGTTIPLTQEVQGRCCGNSVCPPLARALVDANCADLAEFMEAAE